jgi:hypothetical protein
VGNEWSLDMDAVKDISYWLRVVMGVCDGTVLQIDLGNFHL